MTERALSSAPETWPWPDSLDASPHIEWLDPEGLHAVENIDNRSYHALRIELKAGK